MSLTTYWRIRAINDARTRFGIALQRHWLITKWALVDVDHDVSEEFGVEHSERWSTGMPACLLPTHERYSTNLREWSTELSIASQVANGTYCSECYVLRSDFIRDHGASVFMRGRSAP